MKRFLLIACILIPVLTVAQSFQITNSTPNVSGDGSTTIEGHADLKNISSSTKIVRVERIQNTLATGHLNYFCWDECLSPNGNISGNDTILAGATSTKFKAYLTPGGNMGTSTASYKFFDINNPSDSIVQQFTFVISTSTSSDKTLAVRNVNELSLAYPNPAGTYTRIDYELSGSAKEANIKIYNILGSEIRKIELANRQGTVSIDTDSMTEGMYLYSLVVNGKTISTKKFIVKK
jgi:hypothetical protein